MNLPNILTTVRIILSPLVLFFVIKQNYSMAMILFIAGVLTDFWDGYLARHFKKVTKLGERLDQVADKIFYGLTFIGLLISQVISFPLLLLLLFKDIIIVLGYVIFFLLGKKKYLLKIKVNIYAKITVLLQSLSVVAIFLDFLVIPSVILTVCMELVTLVIYSSEIKKNLA